MNNTPSRIAELSATLPPINEIDGCITINEEMYSIAEDSNSYNSSYYCDGWVKPVFDGDFRGCLLCCVGEYQVLRFYGISMQLEGLAYDEILEDDDFDLPEPEITGYCEYQQIWLDPEGHATSIILSDSYSYLTESHLVKVAGLMPWARQNNIARYIIAEVNECDYCYTYGDSDSLRWQLSYVREYLAVNEPDFLALVEYCSKENWAMDNYRTLKVCHRHGYALPTTREELNHYIDYLNLLARGRYCLTEPRYVCPDNLAVWHDKMLAEQDERTRLLREKEAERMRLQRIKDEEEFAKLHGWLFDIHFDNGHFRFDSLDSTAAYEQEGEIMHHCIYHCKFYDKHHMLAMHISDMEGNRVATCTIDLATRTINQIQPISNDTGYFRTYGEIWQDTNEYKEIWNVLSARMHTFPQYNKATIKKLKAA